MGEVVLQADRYFQLLNDFIVQIQCDEINAACAPIQTYRDNPFGESVIYSCVAVQHYKLYTRVPLLLFFVVFLNDLLSFTFSSIHSDLSDLIRLLVCLFPFV